MKGYEKMYKQVKRTENSFNLPIAGPEKTGGTCRIEAIQGKTSSNNIMLSHDSLGH